MSRSFPSRRRWRRGVGLPVTLAVVGVAASGAFVVSASASASLVSSSGFEIDQRADGSYNGNLKVDTPGNLDWLGDAGTGMRPGVGVFPDDPSGGNDSAFSSGTKEDSAVPTLDNGGIPPNKSDLKHFGVLKSAKDGKSYLHLFWTRVQDPSGTTNMDFEFNQSKVSSNLPAGSTQVVPVRTPGDLLLTYDLSRGGTQASISKRTWGGTAWGAPVALTGAQALGTINTTEIPATETGTLGALSPRTFGEATIDLSSVFTSTDCVSYGSAYLKSRSSDSFTAALKDFIPPRPVDVSNCATIKVKKTESTNGGPKTSAGGAVFALYKDVGAADGTNSPTAAGDEDETLLNRVGTCTSATVSTSTTAVGDCVLTNVKLGTYWIVETQRPTSGHQWAADVPITVTTPDAVMEVDIDNPLQPSSVSVTKVDETGAALGGVAFTLHDDKGTVGGTRDPLVDTVTNPARSCTTSALDGLTKGTCTISGVPVGRYWLVETVPSGYAPVTDQHVDITGGGQTKTYTVVNHRQYKVVTLVCQMSGTPTPVAATVTHDKGSTTTAQQTVSGVSPEAAAALCALGGSTTMTTADGPLTTTTSW